MRCPSTYHCPVEATLELIGGKYKALILFHLVEGALRFSELHRLIPQATPKMLTQQLRELEADGFLYTVAGKGCFVAEKNLDLIREQKLKELEDHLDAAVELAAQCGVSALELMEMLRILLKEEEPHV